MVLESTATLAAVSMRGNGCMERKRGKGSCQHMGKCTEGSGRTT